MTGIDNHGLAIHIAGIDCFQDMLQSLYTWLIHHPYFSLADSSQRKEISSDYPNCSQ
jgi:hypothetical protein